MENGEWKVENGEWRMENGEWKVENANEVKSGICFEKVCAVENRNCDFSRSNIK
jgi:hypothetical protein